MHLLKNQKKPKSIFIIGPTASEKTKMSIELSKYLNIEIVSVDSVLIYKGMNIGTAKPTIEERKFVKHRLIDIIDPKEYYSIAKFYKDSIAAMKQITSSGKIPVLVGGSMLYFKILLNGLSKLPVLDLNIRSKISLIFKKFDKEYIYWYLMRKNPNIVHNINPNDYYRLFRALENFLIFDNNKIIPRKQNKSIKSIYDIYQFIFFPINIKKLYRKIEIRFLEMLQNGFENEVRIFYERKDLNKNLPSMKSIGYRQMWNYFAGKLSYKEMIKQSIYATRKLIKHQLTWLKKWEKPYNICSNNLYENIDNILHIFEK